MSSAETRGVGVGRGPLSDRTIVVTRPETQAAELADALEAFGADVLLLPTIAVGPPADPGPLEVVARGESVYDWVIFTSVNGVGAVCEAADRVGIGVGGVVGAAQVCCVGPATARAAEDAGLVVSVIPDRYVAEAVVETLAEATRLEGARVLLPVAGGARDVLPNELRRHGAIVQVAAVYETVLVPNAREDVHIRLAEGVDMVTFTSPSAVRGFHGLGEGGPCAAVAVIGPVTALTARDLGYDVTVQAEEFTVGGLAKAIVRHYTEELS